MFSVKVNPVDQDGQQPPPAVVTPENAIDTPRAERRRVRPGFQTPDNMSTSITYASLGVTPNLPIDEDEAWFAIRNDGIQEQPFYKSAEAETKAKLDACLLFLYGRRFYWYQHPYEYVYPTHLPAGVPVETRVKIISDMLSDEEGVRRLSQILSALEDEDMSGEEQPSKRYEVFVKTIWRLLDSVNSKSYLDRLRSHLLSWLLGKAESKFVGFKKQMETGTFFLRYQTWGNGFLVGACLAFGATKRNALTMSLLGGHPMHLSLLFEP